MKRVLTVALALLAMALFSVAPAGAQDGARIHLIHGIPDTDVDVAAGGEVVIEGFAFGDTEDLSAMAGQTLAGLQVLVAGTEDVAIDAGDVTLPESGNYTIIAHLDAAGTPTLTVFENDTAEIAAGSGRLVVRHTAAAPAVDVKADGEVAFENLENPNEAAADLPVGTISAEVVPTGADEPVVIGPADLAIDEGTSLIVYAVGSLDAGNVSVLTETIEGLGAAAAEGGEGDTAGDSEGDTPTEVNTGNSPVSDDGGSALPWIIAATAGVLATAVGARRLATVRR